MAAPKTLRLRADFDEWFPQGLFLVGEITPVMEYQSQEDRARNRPARPRTDEVTGLPLFRGTFADPAAEKERDKSVTVEFACTDQPVPLEAVAGLPFRSVVLDETTVAPRAEVSRTSQMDHLDDPGHRHETTPHSLDQRERSRKTGSGQIRHRPGRHDEEDRSMTSPNVPATPPTDPNPPRPVTRSEQKVPDQGDHHARHGRRKTIPATCERHRGPIGFTNLQVTQRDNNIVLDPHVDGSCVIYLNQDGATELRDTLTEWLG
ncbi:MAG: hypothetical protein M3460_16335 [Actinomycetota bacterium]|nr:hypothetical protein [Actinomycetota bacterium]